MADESENPALDSQTRAALKKQTLSVAATFFKRLFDIFALAFLLIAIQVTSPSFPILRPFLKIAYQAIVLIWSGFLLAYYDDHFNPIRWSSHIVVSIYCAVLASFAWHWSIPQNQARTLKAAFWLGSLLVYILLLLLMVTGTPAVCVLVIFSSVAQALCYSLVIPGLRYAAEVIRVSSSARRLPDNNSSGLLCWTIFSAILHSSILICGIGGAIIDGKMWDTFFIIMIMGSIIYTMYVTQVALLGTIGILVDKNKMLTELVGCYNFLNEAHRFIWHRYH